MLWRTVRLTTDTQTDTQSWHTQTDTLTDTLTATWACILQSSHGKCSSSPFARGDCWWEEDNHASTPDTVCQSNMMFAGFRVPWTCIVFRVAVAWVTVHVEEPLCMLPLSHTYHAQPCCLYSMHTMHHHAHHAAFETCFPCSDVPLHAACMSSDKKIRRLLMHHLHGNSSDRVT